MAAPIGTEALLEVRGVSKRFGALRALDGVSFDVRRGEMLGLIGPNGAGKTTLFECLAGVLPADAGEVRSQGRVLEASERGDALFFLPDGIVPWGAQPVGRVLRFFAGLFVAEPGALARLSRLLSLEPYLPSLVEELSKGERKRLLLALGLLSGKQVLLLDEPFDGLDLRQAHDVESVLREAARGGRTLFLSIHQLEDASRVCERLVLLADGRVVGEGTLAELSAKAGVPPGPGALGEVFLALT